MSEYKSIYSGAQIDMSLGRIINGELDDAVEEANEAADRAESAADAIQSAIDNLPVGAVPVIDDLTTGGRTVALSAEQGKGLKSDVDTAQSLAANALDAVEDHVGRVDNPHGVTAPQVGAIPSAEKGAPNGVANLDGDGKVPAAQLLLLNKNSLVNAWFEEPYLVNQRGQSSYSGTWIYTIDLWQLIGGTLNVSTDGITLAAGTNLMYRIEPTMYTSMAGDIYTISVYDGTAYYSATVVAGTTGQVPIANGMKLQLYADAVSSIYGVYLINGDNNISVTLRSAKLELGPASTLHLDTPPSPAEQELNRQVCKRYYQRIPTLYAYGHCATATDAYVAVPMPVPMRITPSIIVENSGALNFGGTVLVPAGIVVAASNNNQVHLGVAGSGMTPNAPCVLHDATIALSADL